MAGSWSTSTRRSTGRSEPLLALGQPPVAPDIAVLGADDNVDGVARAHVANLAVRRGVDARKTTRPEPETLTVAELDLDFAGVDEVELLLLVVVVEPGLDLRRQDDGVDAQLLHIQRAANLAEPVALTEAVE